MCIRDRKIPPSEFRSSSSSSARVVRASRDDVPASTSSSSKSSSSSSSPSSSLARLVIPVVASSSPSTRGHPPRDDAGRATTARDGRASFTHASRNETHYQKNARNAPTHPSASVANARDVRDANRRVPDRGRDDGGTRAPSVESSRSIGDARHRARHPSLVASRIRRRRRRRRCRMNDDERERDGRADL